MEIFIYALYEYVSCSVYIVNYIVKLYNPTRLSMYYVIREYKLVEYYLRLFQFAYRIADVLG